MGERDAWVQEPGRQGFLHMECLGFLEGEWVGAGLDHGMSVQSRATGRALLDGSWLELKEQLRRTDGSLVHQDISLYRYDPVELGFRVIHIMSDGYRREYPVVPSMAGLRWVTGTAGPKVLLQPLASGWRCSITLPGEQEPGLVLTYNRGST